jgi:hypothetical protein
MVSVGDRIVGTGELTVMQCGSCGVLFAMPEDLRDECSRHKGKSWYCPNGHSRIYAKTDDIKLREAQEQLARERALRDQAEAEAEAATRRAKRARAEATKLKTRAKAGVCPCCNRTFQQLARHMKTKHPEFEPETEPK